MLGVGGGRWSLIRPAAEQIVSDREMFVKLAAYFRLTMVFVDERLCRSRGFLLSWSAKSMTEIRRYGKIK